MKRILRDLPLFLVIFVLIGIATQYGQGLAEKGWPKFQGHSLQNIGRSLYAGVDAPEIKWIFDMGSDTRCKNVSVAPDGTIYVGSATKLYALNPDNSVKWSSIMTYPSHVTVGNDGFLRVGTSNCSNDKMYKVDAANGDIVWTYDLSGFSACGLYPSTLANDGTAIFGIGGYSTRYLFALNPDGTERWSPIAFGDNIETLPSITHDGNYIIAGNNLNLLYKVDLNTGEIVASANPPGGKYIPGHVAIADNGEMYLTSSTYGPPYIYKYNSNLELQWMREVGAYHYVVPPSIGYDNLIYTGGYTTNKMFVFDANGDQKWEFELDSDFGQPPVIDRNNIVYVVSKNYLYAIEPKGTFGELKWKFPSEGTLNDQGNPQPTIAEDGTIYLLTRDGKLYALGTNIINVTVNIDPDTLNKKSKGKWITAYLDMPDGYDVNNIDKSTVKLLYGEDTEVSADWGEVQGELLMMKFVRSEVIEMLAGLNGPVELKVIGKLDGVKFEGVDTITVK